MRSWFLAAAAIAGCQATALAQTQRPVIHYAFPAGLQRGQSVEISLYGYADPAAALSVRGGTERPAARTPFDDLTGAYRVLFSGTGVTAEIAGASAPSSDGKTPSIVRLKVTAAPGAIAGLREGHLATPSGVSNAFWLVVGEGPEITDREPNDTPATAQPLPFAESENGVVNGQLQADGDRDLFRFTAHAGEEIAFSLSAARLRERSYDAEPRCDPVLTLSDLQGQELATADDYDRADPMLVFRFPKDADYLIEVRDIHLHGRPDWLYRLTVARRPVVTGLFPLTVARGMSVDIQPAGINLGSVKPFHIDVPADAAPGLKEVRFETATRPSAPVMLPVSDLPETVESEGNDTPEHPNTITLPGGVSGHIGTPFDVDYFGFHAERGKALRIQVEAASIGSPLAPQLAVLDARGMILGRALEELGSDPVMTWTPPADGDYLIQVTDAFSRGSDAYRYRLRARYDTPGFSVSLDESRTNLGAGGSAAIYVRATRSGGFNGEIRLAVDGLPAGVIAAAGRIPPGGQDGTIILSVPAGAPPDLAAIRVSGTADVAGAGTTTQEAQPRQATFTTGGARRLFDVESALVCVTRPPDLLITPSLKELTLAPGKRVRLDVEVSRKNGYSGRVALDVVFRHLNTVCANPLPPGVTVLVSQSKTQLDAKETKGWITLEAAPGSAPIERLPIAVLGEVTINQILRIPYASELVMLTVRAK